MVSKQTFNLDVAAKIEQDAVYGALALVEAAQRCNWVPIPGENPPWEARRTRGRSPGRIEDEHD